MFEIWFNKDTIAQTLNSHIQFDGEGYALSDTFYRIEIELLVFKLCPVLVRWSFSKLSSGCSPKWKNESLVEQWRLWVRIPPGSLNFSMVHYQCQFSSLCWPNNGSNLRPLMMENIEEWEAWVAKKITWENIFAIFPDWILPSYTANFHSHHSVKNDQVSRSPFSRNPCVGTKNQEPWG